MADLTGVSDLNEWAESIVGQVIAEKYEVTRVIGMGGMGGVFHVKHKVLDDRPFALKLIIPNPHAGSLEEQEKRFAREAATALTFVHPRTAQVRDFGVDRQHNVMYMAMDYIEGTSLAEVIEQASANRTTGEPVLAFERALRLTLMILDVLETAHAASVIHRDLKPANIMLITSEGGEDDIKILDFGFAKVLSAASGEPDSESGASETAGQQRPSRLLTARLTAVGTILGTAQYMAPEQARGHAVDHRADLYSTGIVLYEMLTGALPHEGSNYHHLLFARATEPPIPIEKARPDIDFSAAVQVILDYALASEAENRFADAAQFARAVEEALVEMGYSSGVQDGQAARSLNRTTRLTGLQLAAPEDALDVGTATVVVRRSRSATAATRPIRRARQQRASRSGRIKFAIILLLMVGLSYLLWLAHAKSQFDSFLRQGQTAFKKEQWPAALKAFEQAREIRPQDKDVAGWIRRTRLRTVLARGTEAADKGNLERLRAEFEAARNLGASEEELKSLQALLRAGGELVKIETLLDERKYTQAGQRLDAVRVPLPQIWSDRKQGYNRKVNEALVQAETLLAAGKRQVRQNEYGKALETLAQFLGAYPHHPDRRGAQQAHTRALAGLARAQTPPPKPPKSVVKPLVKARPTGLQLQTLPPGLTCRLGNRDLGTSPLELIDSITPGRHRIELIDADGFASWHEVEIQPEQIAQYTLDHAAAIAGERVAYARVRQAQRPPRAAEFARRYLKKYPRGAKEVEVRQILRQAEGKLFFAREERAYHELKAYRANRSETDVMLEAAETFLVAYPGSAHRDEVKAWKAEWLDSERFRRLEQKARGNVLDLLQQDGAPLERRVEAVREYVNRFAEAGHAERARRILQAHLIRVLPDANALLLAAPVGSDRTVLLLRTPAPRGNGGGAPKSAGGGATAARLAIFALASGLELAAANMEEHDPLTVSADPAGREVFIGTRAGLILRWGPLPGSTHDGEARHAVAASPWNGEARTAELDSALTRDAGDLRQRARQATASVLLPWTQLDGYVRVMLALGDGQVIVSNPVGRGALMLAKGSVRGGGPLRVAPTRLAGVKGRLRCGARSADGSIVALGDRRGTVTVLWRGGGATASGPSASGPRRFSVLWRRRLRGQVEALAFSGDGMLLAASVLERRGARKTVLWSLAGSAATAGEAGKLARSPRVVGEYPVGSPWLQILDGQGLVLVGGIVVGPESDAVAVPLRIGAASAVDRFGRFLVGAGADGGAKICYLPALLRQVQRVRARRKVADAARERAREESAREKAARPRRAGPTPDQNPAEATPEVRDPGAEQALEPAVAAPRHEESVPEDAEAGDDAR